MVDVASKQQTTALFLSTIVTRTRRHTELTKKTDKPDRKPVLCQRALSSVFRAVFYTVKLRLYGALHLVNIIYTSVIVAADSGNLQTVAV